jgi:uncharacterized membrane protein
MQPENESRLFTDLELDPAARSHIRSMARWAMITVACSVVSYVISLISAFNASHRTVARTEGFDYLPMKMAGSSTIGTAIISVAVGLLINYFLFRFASQARAGVEGLSQQQLNRSFNNLKSYFMATSIIIIIVFIVALLAIMLLGVSEP